MADQDIPLDWAEFPKGHNFRTAWKLTTQEEIVGNPNNRQITGMLEDIITSHDRPPQQTQLLRNLLGRIRSLCAYDAGAPAGWGDMYREPEPSQHIYRRKKNPRDQRPEPPLEVVSTGQGVWSFAGPGVQVAPPGKGFKAPRERNYWSLSDLLGLFFSKLGPAPGGALRLNFFLPLLALYMRWVLILTPAFNKKNEPTPPPSTYSIMWGQPVPGDKTAISMTLGATPGGIQGRLKYSNKLARYSLYTKNEVPTLFATKFMGRTIGSDEKLRQITWGNVNEAKESWAFGNCAETYSYFQLFLPLILREGTPRITPHGFSIQPKSHKLQYPTLLPEYDLDLLLEGGDRRVPNEKLKPLDRDYLNLLDPCNNCKHVISTLSGDGNMQKNLLVHIPGGFGPARK